MKRCDAGDEALNHRLLRERLKYPNALVISSVTAEPDSESVSGCGWDSAVATFLFPPSLLRSSSVRRSVTNAFQAASKAGVNSTSAPAHILLLQQRFLSNLGAV